MKFIEHDATEDFVTITEHQPNNLLNSLCCLNRLYKHCGVEYYHGAPFYMPGQE